jgi:hypothetical protein
MKEGMAKELAIAPMIMPVIPVSFRPGMSVMLPEHIRKRMN